MYKKSLNIHSHVRPNSRTWRVLTLKICRTFWEEYVRPKSMIVDTLGVYCTCMQLVSITTKVVSLNPTHGRAQDNFQVQRVITPYF
jgi:hypothetical protein